MGRDPSARGSGSETVRFNPDQIHPDDHVTKDGDTTTGGNRKRKVYDFDQILDLVGSDDRYQKLLVYGFVCPFSILMPIFALCTVFMMAEPNHWCHVPGNEHGNLSSDEWKVLTLPTEQGPDGHERFSQCQMYNESLGSNEPEVISCLHGWQYDTSDYRKTIPSENDWVCSKSHYTAEAFTASSVGNAVGAIGYGFIGDKYGRKVVFVTSILVNLVARFTSFYITDRFWWFLVLQFLVGTSFPMVYIAVFAIIAEICDKDYRSWIYAVSWICWVFGISSMPLFAWLLANWYTFGLLSLLPLLLVCIYFRYIPESPRWYLSVGKHEEAEAVLRHIAQINGRLDWIPEGEIRRMLIELKNRQDEECKTKNQGVWTLFTKKRVAIRTLLLSLVWSMNALVYYGITLNTTSMAGNQFVNFFTLSIIELPTGWLGGYLVEKTGRRWTQVAFFTLCMVGFLCAGIGVILESNVLIILSLIISKFSVAITSFVVTLQAMEVFPTSLRSTGSGFASTIGSITAVAAPLVVYLGKIHILIPYLSMALMSGIGIISSALLPETFGQSLPETLEDANNLGKNAKFWSFLPKDYKPKRRRSSFFGVIGELTNSAL